MIKNIITIILNGFVIISFLKKYNYKCSDNKSLLYFIKKLQYKKQNEFKQRQAESAVSLYYEIVNADLNETEHVIDKKKLFEITLCYGFKETQQKISKKKAVNKNVNFENWKSAYAELYAAIKVRHYSPKTLKVYAHWIRKFQYFLKNKDTQLLTLHDVKEFLTFLVVKQNVSAST